MVCGIASIVFSLIWFGFFPALAAVITGHLAMKRQPAARGFWITGLITGYIGLAIGIFAFLFIVLAVLVPMIQGDGYYY